MHGMGTQHGMEGLSELCNFVLQEGDADNLHAKLE